MVSRTNNWRSVVIQADPEWPQTSQVVPAYPFSGPGPKNPAGSRANTIDGPNTFLERTEASGVYAGAWQEAAAAAAFGSENPAWAGWTMAQVIDADVFDNLGGPLCRLTLQGGASEGAYVAEMYIGHAAESGNEWDFEATPTPVTYRGQTSFLVPVAGELITDNIDFEIEAGKNLVIRAYFDNDSADNLAGSTDGGDGWVQYETNRNHAARITSDSTWAVSGFEATFISRIEVFD